MAENDGPGEGTKLASQAGKREATRSASGEHDRGIGGDGLR